VVLAASNAADPKSGTFSMQDKKNISTVFSSLSMADLKFDDAFWVNNIPGGLMYSSGVKA